MLGVHESLSAPAPSADLAAPVPFQLAAAAAVPAPLLAPETCGPPARPARASARSAVRLLLHHSHCKLLLLCQLLIQLRDCGVGAAIDPVEQSVLEILPKR